MEEIRHRWRFRMLLLSLRTTEYRDRVEPTTRIISRRLKISCVGYCLGFQDLHSLGEGASWSTVVEKGEPIESASSRVTTSSIGATTSRAGGSTLGGGESFHEVRVLNYFVQKPLPSAHQNSLGEGASWSTVIEEGEPIESASSRVTTSSIRATTSRAGGSTLGGGESFHEVRVLNYFVQKPLPSAHQSRHE
nr:hypothetical protein [Tanacetum cinerariifolium]